MVITTIAVIMPFSVWLYGYCLPSSIQLRVYKWHMAEAMSATMSHPEPQERKIGWEGERERERESEREKRAFQ